MQALQEEYRNIFRPAGLERKTPDAVSPHRFKGVRDKGGLFRSGTAE